MFKPIKLEPANQRFAGIMANARRYTIPRFQRDYAWTEEQWLELWQDIEQMRAEKILHFMGYLVFQTQDDKAFRIIDGQQRLTTLMIIILTALKKLQELVDAGGSEAAANQRRIDEYRRTYIGVYDTVVLTTSPKLTLNRHNRAHFADMVDNLGVPRKHNISATNRLLNKAFEFFHARLDAYKDGLEIASFIADLADGLLFTTITVSDDLDAYTVFETLNARGSHLSTPDLLKNFLLSTLSGDSSDGDLRFDRFEERWADVLEQLGETEFTNFLRSHRGMRTALVHKGGLYRRLKRDIDRADKVMPYLTSLQKNAPVYAALQNAHDEFWEQQDGRYTDAKHPVGVLNLFNIKTPLSLLMAAYDLFSPQDFIKLLGYIVVITMRYNVICGSSPNEQERQYNKAANQLTREKFSLNDLIRQLAGIYPPDQAVKAAFTNKAMPSSRSNKKILYILRALEKQVSGNEPPMNLTIEHILPHHPEDAWQNSFGYDNYANAIDRLGNFALLPASQNMGQETFDEKKPVLETSPYAINRAIAQYDEWNMDTLSQHQRWLAGQAVTTWKISQLDNR